MPTKPTDTIQQIATDTNFTSSPVAAVNGQATKVALVDPDEGFVPGRSAGAANLNWLFNPVMKFIQWVKDGSNTPDKDAHIVETDSDGIINAAGMLVTQGTGYTFGIRAANDAAGVDSTAIRGTHIGEGVGVEGRNVGGTGVGVRGTKTGTGVGDAVLGQASDPGQGAAVRGRAFGDDKYAVWAQRPSDNDQPALFVSGDHATPQYPLVHIGGQTNAPAAVDVGGLYNSVIDMRIADGIGWRSIGHRPQGWIDACEYDNAGPHTVTTGDYTEVESIEIVAARAGVIVIEGSLNVNNSSGSATSVTLQIYDHTASESVVVANGPIDNGHQQIRVAYSIASGSRTLKLRAEPFGGLVSVNFVTLTVKGIF